MDVTSVLGFISTRTEEMSLERRAAYEAAIAADVIPITYDASIHRLIASQIRLTDTGFFEGANRRGARRNVWTHISTFLDMCDVFVGVYYHTLGPPNDAAAGQPWLRFELLRFVASHEVARRAAWLDRGWISADDAVRSPDFLLRLEDALDRTSADSEALRAFLRERVWLYLWHDVEGRRFADTDLTLFLSPFEDLSIRPFADKVHMLEREQGAPELRPVRSAHAELFAELRARFEGIRAGHVETPPDDVDSMIYLCVEEPGVEMTRPGSLYVLLRTCFKLGFRVDCLLAGQDGAWRVRALASAFTTPVGGDGTLRVPVLKRLLQRSLAGYTLEVRPATTADHAELIEASEVNVFRRAQRARTDCMTYRVRIGDVPGTIWTIVSVATAFDATIVHLSYDRRWGERPEPQKVGFSHKSLVVEFELGLAHSGETGEDEADRWTDFEYHLKCVPGYIGSQIVPPTAEA